MLDNQLVRKGCRHLWQNRGEKGFEHPPVVMEVGIAELDSVPELSGLHLQLHQTPLVVVRDCEHRPCHAPLNSLITWRMTGDPRLPRRPRRRSGDGEACWHL